MTEYYVSVAERTKISGCTFYISNVEVLANFRKILLPVPPRQRKSIHTATFSKYVSPFFIIIQERVTQKFDKNYVKTKSKTWYKQLKSNYHAGQSYIEIAATKILSFKQRCRKHKVSVKESGAKWSNSEPVHSFSLNLMTSYWLQIFTRQKWNWSQFHFARHIVRLFYYSMYN